MAIPKNITLVAPVLAALARLQFMMSLSGLKSGFVEWRSSAFRFNEIANSSGRLADRGLGRYDRGQWPRDWWTFYIQEQRS